MRTRDRISEGEVSEAPEHGAGGGAARSPKTKRRGQARGPKQKPRRPNASREPEHLNAMRAAADAPSAPGGPRGGFGAERLKVDVILKEADRPAYESLLADAGTTGADAIAWLRARGYRVGSCAVLNHRRNFNRMVREVRQTARFADALADLARRHGTIVMSDLTLTRLQQLVMQRLMREPQAATDEKEEVLGMEELGELSKMVKDAVGSRRHVEAMRSDDDRRRREAAAEAQKAAKGGASGQAVADRVREILGIPLGDADPATEPPFVYREATYEEAIYGGTGEAPPGAEEAPAPEAGASDVETT